LLSLTVVDWPKRFLIEILKSNMAACNLSFFAGVKASSVAVGTAIAPGSGPIWAGLLELVLLRRSPTGAWWLGTLLAVPATPDTIRMIGAPELAAMRPGAVLLNVARGTVLDQDALLQALRNKTIAAAFLDVTDPEPLPADHPLWDLDNAHISMHLSGRAQTLMFQRSAQRFIDNLARYRCGQPLLHQVDLNLGY